MVIFRVEASRSTASEMTDVYSFGVFLLELVTGHEALHNENLGSNESLFQWVSEVLSQLIISWWKLLRGLTREHSKSKKLFEFLTQMLWFF